MSKVYTFFYNLEKRFPSLIFEINYSKVSKMGNIKITDRNKLNRKKKYEIHYFKVGEPISVFEEESGKKVNILKEIKIFIKYIEAIKKDPYGTDPRDFWKM